LTNFGQYFTNIAAKFANLAEKTMAHSTSKCNISESNRFLAYGKI
jgi:hypothetical protein